MHLPVIENIVYNDIFAYTISLSGLNCHTTNIKISVPKLTVLPFIFFLLAACNPTKYVPSGELLLSKNHLVIGSDSGNVPAQISKGAMKPYIKQQPNKRIFGARFHLGLYNFSNIDRERWPHGWLRKIGEEPVIFDPLAAERTKNQLEGYLDSKGYFNGTVEAHTGIIKKEAEVFYNISPGIPYTIRDIRYEIEDSLLYGLVMIDTMNCTIERGMNYDVDLLQKERQRLERFIRDIGFYAFSTEDIFFRVDSSLSTNQVNVYYAVSRSSSLDSQGKLVYSTHRMFRVRDVYIYPEFDPREALTQGEDYLTGFDTTSIDGFHFIIPPGKQYINPEVLKRAIYVMPGALYSVTNTEATHDHLAELKNHRLININYAEVPGFRGSRPGEGTLDCIIQLTPMDLQSYTIELEGTNSGGNLGGAVNLIYQNKSLFHGAENFSLKLKGAYETLTEAVTGFKNSQEYGVEATLRLPKFLMPYPSKELFIRKHDPKTVLQAGYNFQKMPVYTRTMANLTVGYSWKGNRYTSHTFNPLVFDVVNLPYISPSFAARIDTTSYLKYSYRDVMVLGTNYNFVFNNQMIRKSKDYWHVRLGFDAAGNLLSLGYKIAGADKVDDAYQLLKQPFAQYVKGEIDASYHRKINEVSTLAYRFFTGVGWPYGNSRAMPFEEQYFGGGSNDIRAWLVRTLGPGSYVFSDTTFINQTADIKLEANAEYRFKLFWILEGALFLDAGNIWTFREDIDRPGGQFKINKFIDDIAVGTGMGLRLDIKFVLLRVDFGIKLRDPQLTGWSKWIPLARPYNLRDDMTMVVGIGYPF